MDYSLTKKAAQEQITAKLSHFFGVTPEEANYEQFYKAIAMITRDMLRQGRHEFEQRCEESGSKRVYYMCMEFLMGRSLKNTLYNLNLIPVMEEALKDFGIKLDKLYECEPDAGLGNGGLGRLAACYLDALATDGYLGMGYSILYEYGIFKQKLVDGWQTEMPDFWLPGGEVWLVAREEKSVDVSFEGEVVDHWEDGYHSVDIKNAKKVHAVPYDMMVAGKDGKGVSVLRLWSAKSSEIDMNSFNQGDYLRAMEQNAMAEVISKVLYPADNHPEGKSLRLRQQYFLVSASVQDIVNRHLRKYGSLDNICDKMAIHINDTHPTLAIPELMRLLLDECGYSWDDVWDVVTKVFAYTNHTVMSEALECWSEDLFRRLLPRIYQIVKEIDNRFRSSVWEQTHDANKVERMAVISNGVVRMANLCVACCHSVNGVSALHSEILKDSVFHDFYTLTPDKFCNVTNGIAHRRWLCQANPRLTSMLSDLIGGEFVYNVECLSELAKYKDNPAVLAEIEKIKTANKADFAKRVKAKTGIELDPNSIFDVQVKRLHEYKRQHLNALNILAKYLAIKANPSGDFTPHTYIFGAKAASGYFMAKKIISFICALADLINNDPDVKGRLKVVYMEDYNVSMAEYMMPAADVSEQISLAGTEASGTGNMKLMMNGAITLGTLDGANVEIHDAVGDENIVIFGMTTPEVNDLRSRGYVPMNFYNNNAELRNVIDFINRGFCDKQFPEISGTIVYHDPYMVLADFADYRQAQNRIDELWADRTRWNSMSLMNTACSGRFAADRAINEYAKNIWHTVPAK
ncbi:MAG: glycogen/starch/alpha-glucan phosphorylase [Oscillospiraceae bacterium]|nr:glycogen/starch/alpha-glucan phosphorylase [Oscillospiraceae bacterium]